MQPVEGHFYTKDEERVDSFDLRSDDVCDVVDVIVDIVVLVVLAVVVVSFGFDLTMTMMAGPVSPSHTPGLSSSHSRP